MSVSSQDRVFYEGRPMPNFTPWYRREEYALMREILDDGDTLPFSFDEWEREAENNKH